MQFQFIVGWIFLSLLLSLLVEKLSCCSSSFSSSIIFGLMFSFPSAPLVPLVNAQSVSKEITASMETVQLAAAQTNGNCERYRHGYLGYTLCVDYYTEVRDGETFVQVVGALTNEGSVHLCNLHFDIEDIKYSTTKNPSWLPNYPEESVFKAGSYFPFFLIIPWEGENPAYPTVAIEKTELYGCDGGGNRLNENELRPNMNWKKEQTNGGSGQGQNIEGNGGQMVKEEEEEEEETKKENEIKSGAASLIPISFFHTPYNWNRKTILINGGGIIWIITFVISILFF